jgi:hypothetical protein
MGEVGKWNRESTMDVRPLHQQRALLIPMQGSDRVTASTTNTRQSTGELYRACVQGKICPELRAVCCEFSLPNIQNHRSQKASQSEGRS